MGQQAKLSQQQRQTYVTMPEEARQRLKDFAQRYKNNMERNPGLYSEFIHSVFAKTILEQQLLMENAGENCMDACLGNAGNGTRRCSLRCSSYRQCHQVTCFRRS